MIVGVINPKGGGGKTTTTITIADGLFRKDGDVLLIDTDMNQQSALIWSQHGQSRFVVNAITAGGLETALTDFKSKFKHIVVDTGSSSDPSSKLTQNLLVRLADVIIMPLQPSPHDFDQIDKPIAMIKERWALAGQGIPKAAFLLTRYKANTILGREAKQLLADTGIPLLPSVLHESERYKQCAGRGVTIFDDDKYHADGSGLIKDIEELLK